MVSSFKVYLVMQLDDIRIGLAIFGVVFSIGGAIAYNGQVGFFAPALAALGVLLWGISTFLPSSKTAAAMIVIPAITQDEVVETVSGEAKELYALTKDALRELAKKPVDIEKNGK